MAPLASQIDLFLTLHAEITATLDDPEHRPTTPDASAIKRLREALPIFPPQKRAKVDSPSQPKSKGRKRTKPDELDEAADERILSLLPDDVPPPLPPQDLVALFLQPPLLQNREEEDAFLVNLIPGFSSPDSGWPDFLRTQGLGSTQTVTIASAAATAAAKVPGAPQTLIAAETTIAKYVNSGLTYNYAMSRIILLETLASHSQWDAMTNIEKGDHNRAFFIEQHPHLFDATLTRHACLKMIRKDGKHHAALQTFIKTNREPLIRARNQLAAFYRAFGLPAVIHPSTSLETLGRHTPTLSRVGARLESVLDQRPDLRAAITARAASQTAVLRDFLRALAVPEAKDPVREFITDFTPPGTYRYSREAPSNESARVPIRGAPAVADDVAHDAPRALVPGAVHVPHVP
ncbi:hypothetical protein B0H15DRAFT_952540 [Mycena belliarum]|uniref:Uncharacterized protein n=1 Tax=Mycena belliarum TaxID=1033014 RepID=A0AAD6XN10_9AGAR|nr:hypothetical protein B0H15DRAFT_952540 [Mycena belliae]